MTKEELEKLKQTIAYFGHWYDVIGEERVLILEKSIEYITDLEGIKLAQETALNKEYIIGKQLQKENAELEKEKCELLGIIQGKDNAIAELKEQIEKMKCCSNCKHSEFVDWHCEFGFSLNRDCINLKDKWELKE